MTWPFGSLPQNSFDLIMADPPWTFKTRSPKGITKKGAGGQYATMRLEDIGDLPVAALAANNCLLWLWATNPMLPQALATMALWGFEFKTAGHWVKRTKNNCLGFGTGYILRSAGEPFLIGTRGQVRTSRSVRSVIEGRVREHSRKPEQAYTAAECLVPGARRAELFSRESRLGWRSWGNEATKFDPIDALDLAHA